MIDALKPGGCSVPDLINPVDVCLVSRA